MRRKLFLVLIPLLVAGLSGCATMSKEECMNANWRALGYGDGARGVHYAHLEKRREACGEYAVTPDDVAYREGWDQGIHRYCSYDTGVQTGSRGARHITYCPSDVAPDYLDGWRQGVRQYCQPERALKLGLSGHRYSGVCPVDMADAFEDLYRLGRDVRQARATHHELEERLDHAEHNLLAAKDPKQHRDLLHEVARLRHDENRSDARVIALEACMSDDWYDAGYRDGEDGQPERYRDIANTCRNYGLGGDRRGYREGWRDGVRDYCSYDSGLYAGQNNLEYLGVCSGYSHSEFWRGYERGRDMFRHERYEMHPRPVRNPQPRRPVAVKPQMRYIPAAKSAPARKAVPEEARHQRPEAGQIRLPKQPQPKAAKEAPDRPQAGKSNGRRADQEKKAEQQPEKQSKGKADKSEKNHGKSKASDREAEKD